MAFDDGGGGRRPGAARPVNTGGGGGRRSNAPKTAGPTDLEQEKSAENAHVIASSYGFGLQGKFKPNDLSHYINPAADRRLNSIIWKTGSPLIQGIIQQTDAMVVSPQLHPYACRFMFNPTTINVGYQSQEEVYPASSLTAAQLASVQLGPGTTGLSFSLLFDRTYEVAYGTGAGDQSLRDLGVYRDIAALESVVGARFNFAQNPEAVIQPMQLVPSYFVFGGGNGTVGLKFIGAITSLQVTYSTFSERMVPMRAGVDISVQQTLGEDITKLASFGGTILQRETDRQPGRTAANGSRTTNGGVTA